MPQWSKMVNVFVNLSQGNRASYWNLFNLEILLDESSLIWKVDVNITL